MDWRERYPFPPENKLAVKLPSPGISRFYGEYPHCVETWMMLSQPGLTHSYFDIYGGGQFSPADIHAGEEIYYIMNGEVCVYQPNSGQVVSAEEGEIVVIPKNAPHVTFNFTNTKVRILTFFAPKIWDMDESSLTFENALPGMFVLPGSGRSLPESIKPHSISSKFMEIPVDIETLRKEGIIYTVNKHQSRKMIHGAQRRSLVEIYVSIQYITVGKMTVNPGFFTEAETHTSDKVIRVLSGRISVEINPSERRGLSALRTELTEGDTMFIPGGKEHALLNFARENSTVIFAVAGEYQ